MAIYPGRAAAPRSHRVPALLRAPLEGRTWREFLHLLLGLPIAVLCFAYTVVMTALGVGLLVTFLGVPVLAAALAGARALGALERVRARALLGLEVAGPAPVRPGRDRRGPLAWLGALLKDGASWRHLLYMVVRLPWAVAAFGVSLTLMALGWLLLLYPAYQWMFPAYWGQPGIQLYGDRDGYTAYYFDTPLRIAACCVLGLLVVLATPWVIRGLAQVDRVLVLGLLGPSLLEYRVRELETTRGTAFDTASADLRRIERDLRDGAQARLTAIESELGLAKETLAHDPRTAARMVDEAHGEVKLALRELRDLARGIHPAILTDRGLGPALSALAARCAVPVRVEVGLPARPAPAIEGLAYFTVAELLRNVGRHSGARSARVDVWRADDRLLLMVTDDGRGGATAVPAAGPAGHGLADLAGRLRSVDGMLLVDSPAGGPTSVTAELPWRQ
ncbi:sensor histidine kinase [Streptomyces gamaensis]|uniref:histidine kinase n=1 Tax=Streptomyces gamaensis TaxID=1763542 RepID=A0ABW0Z668_9ACTN